MVDKISRRKFLVYSLASGITLYTGGWWLFKVRPQNTNDIVLAILEKHVGYLKISEDDKLRFANEMQELFPEDRRHLISWLGLLTLPYKGVDFAKLPLIKKNFRLLEERVVGHFLLSTDFFWADADESREISYLGTYRGPTELPCSNPFAQLS